jgi:hypothetical protein
MSMMLTFRAGKLAALALLLPLAAACSREQQDWRSAEATDTVESYGQFLEQHPESELAREARTRVAQLSEDREWQHAGSADTADAYRQFLAQYPNGKWAQEARIRIQNFALNGLSPAERSAVTAGGSADASAAIGPLASAGSTAAGPASSSAGLPAPPATALTAPSLSTPYISSPRPATYPLTAPPPNNTVNFPNTANSGNSNITAAAAGASMAAATTGYSIQLGAFASEIAASNEWQQLTARFSAELRGLSPRVVTANTTTGLLFRLQAQVADEARARSLCDMLRKQSQACVPVLPH